MHLIPCTYPVHHCIACASLVCLGGKWSGEWQISKNFGACGASGRVAKRVVLGMNSWQTRVLLSKKEVTQSVLSSLFQPIAMEVPQTMRLGRLVRA